MSATIKGIAPESGMSFYDKAAWYIFITPFAAVAIGSAALIVTVHISSLSRLAVDNIQQAILLSALAIESTSFILGFSVCCMIRRHRRKLTIWIGVLGILTSFGLGAMTLFGLALSNMGNNC